MRKEVLPRGLQHFTRMLIVMTISTVIVFLGSLSAGADTITGVDGSADSAWLEPRGINIADLVGLVPEDHLRGAIINYSTGEGVVQYLSGRRDGSTVTIEARLIPRFGPTFTKVPCLGKVAHYDEWPSPSPAAAAHIFEGGVDITQKTVLLLLAPAGQTRPQLNSSAYQRYGDLPVAPIGFDEEGALKLPANMGCNILIDGKHLDLTARFTITDQPKISVSTVGSETFWFQSYIGPGSSGLFGSLNEQMSSRFGNRHGRFSLEIPSGADYVLVKFPLLPIDPYVGKDAVTYGLAGSGSYRLAPPYSSDLSVDHVNTMAIPLQGQWRDADQSGGATFLPFFADSVILAPPEYFLPAGFRYDPCMTNGGCPAALLDQIYDAKMEMSVYYYKIERVATGLVRIPLRQVGPAASLQDLTRLEPNALNPTAPMAQSARQKVIFLPLVVRQPSPEPLPPDDHAGCPCGWFDQDGRMLDFIR
jgi:hypothetical protein